MRKESWEQGQSYDVVMKKEEEKPYKMGRRTWLPFE